MTPRVGALLAPRSRLLPAAGARLERRPRVLGGTLAVLRHLPGRRLRRTALRAVAVPLLERVRVPLEVVVAGGNRMRVELRDIEGKMLATSGVWEPQTVAVMMAVLGPGDVAVDLGANIGFFSLLASQLVGPRGRVYAVEPAPETFAELVHNLELNDAGNVVPERVAAGAEPGEAVLYDVRAGDNHGAASIRRGPDEHTDVGAWRPPVSVSVAPVDELVDDEDLPRIRLIKIDVEGAEGDVLAGLDPLFEQGLRPALEIEIHTQIVPEAPRAVADFCRRHDLAVHRILDDRDADREEAMERLRLAPLTPDGVEQTRDDYFYVLVTGPDDAAALARRIAETEST
ncbi:MAG: FkbM family methyltransferase [Pseudomonadota bacterium]